MPRKGTLRLPAALARPVARLTGSARAYQNPLTETACTGVTLGGPNGSEAPVGCYLCG
jgi:hypothetical protein